MRCTIVLLLQLAAGMIILINVVAAVILKWFFIPTYPFSIIIVTILGYGAIFLFLAKVREFTCQYCPHLVASAPFMLLIHLQCDPVLIPTDSSSGPDHCGCGC